MGKVFADIDLINASDIDMARAFKIGEEEIRRIRVRSLVDTGAYQLCINEVLADQLGLRIIEKRTVRFADGSTKKLNTVGPIELHFETRKTITQALVLPGEEEVLLGSIPLEGMDVLVDPLRERLIVNPDHPYMAVVDVK